MDRRWETKARILARVDALCLICMSLAGGCGTALEDALGDLDLLPDITSVSAEARTACTDVMTEQELVTALFAARFDQANGYTKSEELVNVTTSCALDAVFSGVPADACTACKTAILDQVYGD